MKGDQEVKRRMMKGKKEFMFKVSNRVWQVSLHFVFTLLSDTSIKQNLVIFPKSLNAPGLSVKIKIKRSKMPLSRQHRLVDPQTLYKECFID